MTQFNHHRNALLQNIDREWEALMGAVERLTPVQMTTPDEGGWTPKDNLAHLDEWLQLMLGHHIDGRPAHEVLRLPRELTEPWGNFDAINAALLKRNRERSAAEVLDGLKHTYVQAIDRLRTMPFEQLLQPRRADDPQQRPILLWVLGDTSEHFAEHRAVIERALGK